MSISKHLAFSYKRRHEGNDRACYVRLFPVIQDKCTLPAPAMWTLARTRHTCKNSEPLSTCSENRTYSVCNLCFLKVNVQITIGHSRDLINVTEGLVVSREKN